MVVIRDKRTPTEIKYDLSENASQRTVERVIQLVPESLLVALLEHGAPIEIDMYLSYAQFPAGHEIFSIKPEFHQDSDVVFNEKFSEFIKGKSHIAVCHDWISGTLYLREVTDDTGTEGAA